MALTVTFDHPRAKRTSRHWGRISGSFDFDSSYPTGGELANAANNNISGKFKSCKHLQCQPTSGYVFEYDQTNDKVKAFYPTNPAAHTHTITIAGGEGSTVAIGIASDAANAALSKTTATARAGITGIQNAAIADAVAAEVANDANLVALTGVRFIAEGTL